MLTTLLTNLQSLISGRFLVANFFPTLAFWFAHATMFFFLNSPFEDYVRNNIGQTAGLTSVVMLAALIAVAFTAYAESALLPFVQSVMEGNWPSWLTFFFAPSQMKEYERLDREIAKNRRLRGRFGVVASGQSQAEAWQAALSTARGVGNGTTQNSYTKAAPSAVEVATLARLRHRASSIPADAITTAVTNLVSDLRTHNADRPGPNGDYALEETRQLLWNLIDYADQYAAAEFRSLNARRQFSFGALPVAPTRMGNVARTVQNYTISRYEFDFELLWSRLQFLVQKDKDFGPQLQAVKTQLDFLISCSALTLLWALSWAFWLFISSGPGSLFLCIALFGPGVAYLWYRIAVTQYRTFADLLRSSVDLFRFDLLVALGYPLPSGVREERELWQIIDALHALYEIRDLREVPPRVT